MSNTPMTDLYLGRWGLMFASAGGSLVYHAYHFNSWDSNTLAASSCNHDHQRWPLRGAVTAYKEQDISPVRRPCKLCLAALRKAKKEAEDADSA